MATIFLSGRPPRALYRVMMLKNGKWRHWTNYATYGDAELAARGLVQKPE
jgi:hypothetical protein